MLRFVMASPEKTTASRADVSNWRAGEWHHVVVSWFSSAGTPVGLPLWIDKKAVDGPIAGGNTFLDPETMKDTRVWIGDETSGTVMDELIIRSAFEGKQQIKTVYRDYFISAPFSAIEITHTPGRVPSDRRVVKGFKKPFGVNAQYAGQFVPITGNIAKYGPWSDFDAKPFITWKTSDERIAVVDSKGVVTGRELGRCTLTAEFNGMKAEYALKVIPVEQADLDLIYVELQPAYRWQETKNKPEPGDSVTSIVHVVNFGYKPVTRDIPVLFELIPERNDNFVCDADEKPINNKRLRISGGLQPLEEKTVTVTWRWPRKPVWVRVTLDPGDTIPEICEANNMVCELNTARPLKFGSDRTDIVATYTNRIINHIGSFSLIDWVEAEKLRMDVMLREAVYPCTSPDGIRDIYRIQKFYEMEGKKLHEEVYEKEADLYDGGFPVREPVNLLAIDSAIIHELGHTCLALPDLYGYPVHKENVLLKDKDGEYYAGTEVMPVIERNMLFLSSANNVPCGVGYNSLMNHCHFWIHPSNAGKIQYFAGYRGPRFWGVQGKLVPYGEHNLMIYDVNDEPLNGAAVYVYHVTQVPLADAGKRFFADRPKYRGKTDATGRFRFPDKTCRYWDSPETDAVEGEHPFWNPFGEVCDDYDIPQEFAFTPNVWTVEGLLLIKIVKDDNVEFAWLPLTVFNEEFFNGNTWAGTYEIRTSLKSSPGTTRLERPTIPEAIRKQNLKPIAKPAERKITVACGEKFTLDGSGSSDPEGQPLLYWWKIREGWVPPGFYEGKTCTIQAPDKPQKLTYSLCVVDGIRVSEPADVIVNVVEKD
jgi:hypothetical protein